MIRCWQVEVERRSAVLHNATRWEADFRWALCTSTAFNPARGSASNPAARTAPQLPVRAPRRALSATLSEGSEGLAALALRATGNVDVQLRRKSRAVASKSSPTFTRAPTATSAAAGSQRRIRREVAPVMRCRGPDAPQVRCGLMRCTSKQHDALHNGSACSRDAHCSQYYRTTFANWTFCIAVGSRGVRRSELVDEHGVGDGAHPPLMSATGLCTSTTADILAKCESGFAVR